MVLYTYHSTNTSSSKLTSWENASHCLWSGCVSFMRLTHFSYWQMKQNIHPFRRLLSLIHSVNLRH